MVEAYARLMMCEGKPAVRILMESHSVQCTRYWVEALRDGSLIGSLDISDARMAGKVVRVRVGVRVRVR